MRCGARKGRRNSAAARPPRAPHPYATSLPFGLGRRHATALAHGDVAIVLLGARHLPAFAHFFAAVTRAHDATVLAQLFDGDPGALGIFAHELPRRLRLFRVIGPTLNRALRVSFGIPAGQNGLHSRRNVLHLTFFFWRRGCFARYRAATGRSSRHRQTTARDAAAFVREVHNRGAATATV